MSVGLMILLFAFVPQYFAIGDLIIDFIIVAAIINNFMQEKEKANVFFYKRYIQPLKIQYYKDRSVFTNRVEVLANSVIRHCEGEDAAIQLVKLGQELEVSIFEEGNTLT